MLGSNLDTTDASSKPESGEAKPTTRPVESDLEQSHRALHLVISSLPHVLLQIRQDNLITAYFIPADFPRILNMQALAPDQPLMSVIPYPLQAPLGDALIEVRETGKVVTLEQECTVDNQAQYFEIKVAPVLDSANLLITMNDITRRMRAEQAEREQRIFAEALVETATALNSTLELDEVLDHLLASLHRVIPHDRGSIMMVEQGIARVVRCRGYDEPFLQEQIVQARLPVMDVPNLRLMIETQQPLLIRDTSEHPDWLTVADAEQPTGAYAGVPIRGGSEVIGFINLDSTMPGAFTAGDRARLQAFADQAAIALNNARLFKQLQMRNAELDAFTHTVAHDLKSPLASVLGYTNLLEMTLRDSSTPETDGFFQIIDARVKSMGQIIESLLLLATVRDSAETICEVDVLPVIEAAILRSDTDIREKDIAVAILDGLPRVMGYGPWLEEVFANLISNAVKYIAVDQEERRIEIRGYTEDGWVRYEVHDTGPGIDPRDQSRLFHMFTRFHTTKASGHGLGLSIVQRIVTKLGGEVGVESQPGSGSTFWFALPAA